MHTALPDNISTQAERLIFARKKLGCCNAWEFYQKYGQNGRAFSYAKYQKQENGERSLSEKEAVTYGKILRIDWQWLLCGHQNESESGENVVLEVIDAIACCGDGHCNFKTHVIGQHLMSVQAFREITTARPELIKILKVVGDSMEPTINNGDFVWVDISCQSPVGDGIYLFSIGEKLVVKRVQINPLNNSVRILSDNPKYLPITAEDYRLVQVLGRVISFTKMLG